ncbi:MAG TPA: sigma-54 dependent transcriptional regulator [Armatimonadota bacterium]|jgi:DNA-binding NtrC family response regulator
MASKRILVVDDEAGIRTVLTDLLAGPGFTVETAFDGKSAMEAAERKYDAALVDLSLPGASGLDILDALKRKNPDTAVIIMTAYASVQTAIKAMRQGAYDFITKPFDLDEVQLLVDRALERTRLIDENRYLLGELKSRYNFDNVIGHSREVQEAYLMAARVADSNASVLILGETGTGKEFLARAIHYQSNRAEGPFIKVNCAALPESLLESELFGHEKGAFTNAVARRAGRFELADGGTLFLDEIGDITPATQVKLLRVLQEKQFERVGGQETLQVNVRIVAATNRDLEAAMEEGSFREDLYYRLNVISIHLPPLRERPDDVPRLVTHFIAKYNQETAKRVLSVSDEGLEMLKRHNWRGNIRELENCIERAVILANDDCLQARDLLLSGAAAAAPALSAAAPTEGTAGLTLREVERRHILATLESCEGNQSKAAAILGIDRKTLRTKVREYGMADNEEE